MLETQNTRQVHTYFFILRGGNSFATTSHTLDKENEQRVVPDIPHAHHKLQACLSSLITNQEDRTYCAFMWRYAKA